MHSRSLEDLARKSLTTFITKGRLRLADVRALAEPYPMLQAQRVAITQAVALFAQPGLEDTLRFGRYPHRNAILGRQSTPEELAFLKEPGSGF